MKLTKIFALLCFLTVFASSSIAQSLSVRAGLNIANANVMIDGEKLEGLESLPGFQFGLLGEIGSEMLALEIGALYSQKGYSFDESVPIFQDVEGTVTINYLEIPINGKVKFGSENAKLHVAVGPYVGFALNGKTEIESALGNAEEDLSFGDDEDDDFKPLDYGLNFGVGAEFSRIQIGATYGLGLANLNTSDDDDDSFKNNVIQIHVGYRIIQ